jgi:CDP-6-deoxy-D-xylo-4-hexulose-3-dehydrase
MSALDNIHAGIRDYCKQKFNFKFDPQNPSIKLHEPTFAADEIIAAIDVLLSTNVTMGPKVRSFEDAYCQKFDHKNCIMSNSGSSANLLAVAALVNPATSNHLIPGDEVIVPALSWSTTVWPLIQCGLVPVIVDIDLTTLNICPDAVRRAIGPRTKAIKIVHVYGNPCDMDSIMQICKEFNLQLIEDTCESMGASYRGTPLGKFGRAGTFSTYFSHHITTLEGGLTVSEDDDFSEVMRALRAHGWVRELRTREQKLAEHPNIDPRFLFVNIGYNLRATELQGAMGTVQLPKLDEFISIRKENSAVWRNDLDRWSNYFEFQTETEGGTSSWFGFPMIIKENAPFSRRNFQAFMSDANIETRPIIAGNIAEQPALKMYPHRISGALSNSDRVMSGGVTFGNHQFVDKNARDYATAAVAEFMKKNGINH